MTTTTVRPGDVGHRSGDAVAHWGYEWTVDDDGSNFSEWAACAECGGVVDPDDSGVTHI